MSTRIILADDHKIIRDGLRSLLDQEADMEVIDEATNGRRAVELAAKHKPNVMVMDIGMPDLNGIEATRMIKQEHPRIHVIALSMHSDSQFIGRMLQAGASAYLLKDCAVEELVKAIRTVLAGRTFLSPDITGVVVEDYVRRLCESDAETPAAGLTPKEREVLQLLAEGNTTKEIAAALFVSVKTIETHRQHIMQKLDIHSVAGLTKYAIRQGLTELER